MSTIIPVVLAGGSGTRLWPVSRATYPKQFSKILDGDTLFQKTSKRLKTSKIINFAPQITLTNEMFRFIISQQLDDIGIKDGSIIIEPEARNTAPPILAASIIAQKQNENATLLVVPSDHIIYDEETFHNIVLSGLRSAESGDIVTFGIEITRPETGYGYLELMKGNKSSPLRVKNFIEKPSYKKSIKMHKSKSFLWNSGMYLFLANTIISAFEKYSPLMLRQVRRAVNRGEYDLNFFRLSKEGWNTCKNISIDFEIMEKAKNIVAIPLLASWTDLGDWNAVWQEQKPDKQGVVHSDNVTALNCRNVLLRSEEPDQQLIGLGLDNIIAIAMKDAVLVANKNNAQDVKNVVSKLKEKDIHQVDIFPKDHRPWGWFENLISKDNFKVKRILVNPGQSLSLQSHKYRSEHWVVVDGEAKVTIERKIETLLIGQSVYIPAKKIHRLENKSKLPLTIIEVQTGSYLGEDDIKRYEDDYSRN